MGSSSGDHHGHDFESHLRACIAVFFSLLVLTVITVLVSYVHYSTESTIAIALTIASIKAAMVMLYFMHLVSEKKLIYFSLGITTFFAFMMMVLIAWNAFDVTAVIRHVGVE